MFRYLVALILLVGLFSMPIRADEKDKDKKIWKAGPCAPATAHVTSFEILVVNISNGERDRSAIRIMADGNFACKHMTVAVDDDWKKTTTVEVQAKLTVDELKSVSELFAKLEIDTLETTKVDEEPEKFVIIQAHDGKQAYRYANPSLTAFGEYADRVGPFMKFINKLIENRLK